MKYIKYFESLKNNDEVNAQLQKRSYDFCKKYHLKDFIINNDGSVDVKGTVYLDSRKLKLIPIKFGEVLGNFIVSNNQLKSLEGCPKKLDGDFIVNNNNLTSLKGSPNCVNDFICDNNQLTSLKGCPNKVLGDFSCQNNKIKSLIHGPSVVDGYYLVNNNNLTSLEGCPSNISGDFNCSNNFLETLKFHPNRIGDRYNYSDFLFTDNKIKSLKSLSNIYVYGEIYMDRNPLPEEILSNEISFEDIKQIIKWQEDYCIWNKDETFNKENFQELLDDIINI